jgi:hypothetical protein
MPIGILKTAALFASALDKCDWLCYNHRKGEDGEEYLFPGGKESGWLV